MFIQLNGVWLTNNGSFLERQITSAMNVRLNGKQIVQEVEYLRGSFTTQIARQNAKNTLTFQVSRNVALLNPSAGNPIALAEAFALTYFSLVQRSGALVIVCGAPGENTITIQAPNAVLEADPDIALVGVTLLISYSIQCGVLQQLPAEPITTESGSDILTQSGVTIIP